MKIPKIIKRYCPYCKKHTAHKIVNQKNKGLNKAHTQSFYSTTRLRKRGSRRGHGNLGRYSKKAIGQWKRTGAKSSKKTDFRYTCETCKKTHMQRAGTRSKKIEYTG